VGGPSTSHGHAFALFERTLPQDLLEQRPEALFDPPSFYRVTP
jgi:hypothetical protein